MMNEIFQDDDPSEEEDCPIIDANTCSEIDLENEFQKYTILHEQATSLKKVFALHLSHDSTFSKISTALSNGTVELFNIDSNLVSLMKISDLNKVAETKFLDDNNLLIATNNEISLYDLRTNTKSYSFQDKTDDNEIKPITCFDINANSRLICAGTEQIQHDVYILFFDIRQKSLLGGYWESHQDDITTIRFHPTEPDQLASGSTDGLLNIFDVSKTSEDEALITTINTESSIQNINWHKNISKKDILSCITHTNNLNIYETEGDLVKEFERSNITEAMKRKSVGDCNVINCHSFDDDSMFLLVGSNFNKGEILRSLKIQNKNLHPLANFTGNKQIIRDSIFNVKNNNLITCGEAGIVTIWSPKIDNSVLPGSTMKAKMTSITTIHKKKPY